VTDTAPKRAVIYARISKDREGAGLGTSKQEDDCRVLADRLGFEVVSVRVDDDLTAFKGGSRSKPRPGYNDLLQDIRSGRANAVLAWHTDRLHRDMTELEEYITVCGEGRSGVPTHTVQGGDLDLSTSSGRMVARILGAVARGEVEHMIERQKSAKERTRNAGGWNGGPRPFGYRPDGPSIKQGGEGRLAQVPAEAAAIRDAYAAFLAGSGLSTIAREWDAAGLRTGRTHIRKTSRLPLWDMDGVRHVLLRAANAGLIEEPSVAREGHRRQRTGRIIGKGNWEPIIDEDTWRAARSILTDPARRAGRPGPRPRWLLSSALVCGVCHGTAFRVRTGSAAKLHMYTCYTFSTRDDGRMRVNGCVARRADQLDPYAEAVIIEKLRQPDMARALAKPGVDVAALDARRTVLNAELDAFARQPGITPRQLSIVSVPKLAELETIEQEISAALRGSPLEDFAGADDPEKVWDGLTMERKRAVAAKLLRITLLPLRGRKKPPGWRVGMPHKFDDTALVITSPDGTPWGTPDEQQNV
jgi:DNA invertase Pin-like site-specific DNA recombinase